jgi:hypothetical protein
MENPLLSRDSNLFDFFHEQVGVAARQASIDFSDEGVFYLTNLLVERGRRPCQDEPQTLVELRLKALNGTRAQAIQAYRQLGDIALYITGFFRGSLERRNVGLSYYLDMGSTAYHHLSHLLSVPEGQIVGDSGHKGLDAIFSELARRYGVCSEILREVRSMLRSQSSDTSDQAVLALYEEWLRTGSPHVARRLHELGIFPSANEGGDA